MGIFTAFYNPQEGAKTDNAVLLDGVNRILCKEANWLGDIVMSLPTITALHSLRPDAEITVLVQQSYAPLFRFVEGVQDVIGYSFNSGTRSVVEKLVLTGKLREGQFDLSILLPNSFESALLAYLAKIPKRYGYARDGRQLLLTHKISATQERRDMHQAEYYFELARQAGFQGEMPLPKLSVPAGDRAKIRTFLAEKGLPADARYAVFAPFAAYGESKEWGLQNYIDLAKKCREEFGFHPVLVGTEDDKLKQRQLPPDFADGMLNLCGVTSLEQLVRVLATANLFVGNDSGAMHVSAATGTPTLGIFGSTSPEKTCPLGARAAFIASPVPCRPCFERVCPKNDFKCMTAVSVDDVFAQVQKLLGEKR
jgi:heptosyltransferase-2